MRDWTLEGPGLADPKQVVSQVPAGQTGLVGCPNQCMLKQVAMGYIKHKSGNLVGSSDMDPKES